MLCLTEPRLEVDTRRNSTRIDKLERYVIEKAEAFTKKAALTNGIIQIA